MNLKKVALFLGRSIEALVVHNDLKQVSAPLTLQANKSRLSARFPARTYALPSCEPVNTQVARHLIALYPSSLPLTFSTIFLLSGCIFASVEHSSSSVRSKDYDS